MIERVKFDEASIILDILDSMSMNEHVLESQTKYAHTLQETSSRQLFSRGLTNISDSLFEFFMELCNLCLELLIDSNLHVHGKNLYQFCITTIETDAPRFEKFLRSINFVPKEDFLSNDNDLCVLVCRQFWLTIYRPNKNFGYF